MSVDGAMTRFESMSHLRRIYALGRPFHGRLLSCLVLILAATAIQLMLPIGIQRLFDRMLVARDSGVIHVAAAVLILIFVGRSVLSFIGQFMLQVIGDRVIVELRRILFAHLQSLDLAFHHRHQVGDLMSRLSNDVGAIRNIVANLAISVVIAVFQLLGATAIMMAMNWRLGLIVLAVAPLTTVVSVIFTRRFRELSTRIQDELAKSSGIANESLSGIEVVKVFARESHESARYRGALERFMTAVIGARRIDAFYNALVAFITSASTIAIFWFGGLEVMAGQLTAGTLVAFLLYSQNVTSSIATLAQHYSSFNQTLGATRRVFEIMDVVPAIADRPGAIDCDAGAVALRFDRVGFAYRDGTEVLSDISFEAEPGETVALVGASGAGKSTLLRLVARLQDPTAGAVLLNGRDLREYRLDSVRGRIAVVSQDVFLFAASVRDNIRFGRLDADDAAVEAAAHAANAHAFIEALPEGYDTWVGERGVQLSGGQRQRIAIARALLKDAPLLLLDEATSSVDPASEMSIQQAIARLRGHRTTLVIAHRLQTVRDADRILLLSAGRIVARPGYEELLRSFGAGREPSGAEDVIRLGGGKAVRTMPGH